jgi:hypothetical protein
VRRRFPAGQTFVETGEMIERLMELEQRLGLVVGGDQLVLERHVLTRTAALLSGAPARPVDEDMSHRDGGDSEKVRAIAPVRATGARQLEVELVHERRRRERIVRANGQLATCSPPELVVDERNDLIECFAPTGAKIRE